ncbi:hypothetical protein AIZ13_22090 [Salmonella enterica subsp. enterica serovar Typhimurium]|nr:ead/Ea22-like family protein [Salmonella enterica]KYF18356.1 hypothetical protein AIZ04_22405 [Salmonella enterica subsp. enterica serovar Typhimurium]KYF23398.1 hypothetical protein AIZ13_22090 [Salmonella enterica subsp. enterica serovar Typhimurium]KYI61960.1 hypothetical protein AIZ18_22840 [Salmonella enterica subsp. enterica serovar Typhimurium]KYI63010.1 hypothetical protein AIZ19_21865 [Salmonella enterica subsp. enterica serovar Typhimurium]KYI67950.1 hypothetical protein AIZ17_224
MSNIDKQALREAAVAIETVATPQKLLAFRVKVTPQVVLALLDELDAAEKLATQQGNIAVALLDEVTTLRRNADDKAPELRAQLIDADNELDTLRQRIAELENDCWIYEGTVKKLLDRAEAAESACNEAARILESGERMALTRSVEILRAAGIGVKGE